MNSSMDGLKISKYNSAEFLNMRISNLWQKAHTESFSGNYHMWNITLDKIWSELAGDVDPTSLNGKKIFDYYQKLSSRLAESGILFRQRAQGFAKLQKSDGLIMAKQYKILLDKEIWLRYLQNKQGKGTSYKNPSEDDFE